MSRWFEPPVFKLKKGIPEVIMECPFVFHNWLEREKQDFIELKFWVFRVNRLADSTRRSHGLGYAVAVVGEAAPHTCRRS